jgi:hypothetical protein
MMICTSDEYQRTLEALNEHAEHVERQRQLFEREGLPLDQVERILQPTRSFAAGLREDAEAFERLQRSELGSSEQEVERDERNDYRGTTVERAQQILDVLGVRFRAEAACPPFDDPTVS